MPSTHRTLIADAATLAAPLVLVLGVRTLFTPAPSAAGPATPVSLQLPVPPPTSSKTAKLTPEQQKAADWLAALPSPKGLTSPLDHPLPAPVAQPTPEPPTQPDAAPAPIASEPAVDPMAGLRLTAILGNAEGGLAAINGRVFKIGDVVRSGLHLKRIDAKTSTVFFLRDDGTELRLHRAPEEGLR